MKIILSSHVTQGDGQPDLALPVGLKQAGHRVTLITSYNYSEWIRSCGVGVPILRLFNFWKAARHRCSWALAAWIPATRRTKRAWSCGR